MQVETIVGVVSGINTDKILRMFKEHMSSPKHWTPSFRSLMTKRRETGTR